MDLQLARGTKDVYGEEAILRQEIVAALRKVFECYGFVPLETPIIERYETLSSKYGGGAEILKETFRLKDQGGRELGLRYDLTVPLARFIAMNPQLKMPFKRYQIGEVFRDGPIKLGRYREFTQCDADIVGCGSMAADAEVICLAQDVFRCLGLDVVIKVNNRKVLNGLLESAGIKKERYEDAILSIDKLEKAGEAAVEAELKSKGFSSTGVSAILKSISLKGGFEEKIKQLRKTKSKECLEGANEVSELFSCLPNKSSVEFDVSLARGLSYYTSTVLEVFLKKSKITSSVCAGGRFDEMIKMFFGSKRDFPAVGISFGLDVILDALKEKSVAPKTKSKVFVIPIKAVGDAFKITQQLRSAGINADMDISERGITKNLDYANSLGIPYVVFVGEKELKLKKVKLRDMKTGKEELLSLEELCKRLL